ncbi:hypothetical protein Halhy_6716 (plasmid) [Haliscomenobacter hydrossis DSM 1100]|uniref:Uncharacterized protein n=1 Tax=Haliscomenobacter hydrossis (strain ATCC 27775 / DSM 1100 / LMG 10767 / O) TaxID=760192 RepID=F4L823_HALH1|nr:hypothetical protein Halhy_6716 [Haliscomenobacter hydrossis DSM 1100]
MRLPWVTTIFVLDLNYVKHPKSPSNQNFIPIVLYFVAALAKTPRP